ncbi:MAG TPA: transcriptional regulator PpsR [Rhodanobacteraceae bacterium]
MRSLPNSKGLLGELDNAATAALISGAADISLILDADGVVLEVFFGSESLENEGYRKWVGQPWIETVTPESREKIESLLSESAAAGSHRWRHVNHGSARGADVPILYSAVKTGTLGRIVAFGRDMRDMATLQQRLMDAQQAMERDYWRLRNVETRYRVLFQMSSEAILIVDAASDKIIESNPTAGELLGEGSKRVMGRTLADVFGAESTQVLQTLIAAARASGRADDMSVRIGPERREHVVSCLYFRQGNEALYLLRIAVPRAEANGSAAARSVLRGVDHSADAFAMTDLDGRIITVNRAFLDLAQMPTDASVRGEPLDRWLGRSRVDFSVLMANLRQHATVRLFATILAGEHGGSADVEVSAASIALGDPPCIAFNIRNIGRRVGADATEILSGQPRSVEQLTELVGRVPLKELVRDATDLVEKLCIEAALQLTQDNRASAAEVLGVSRQNLYVKLRRFGLADFGSEVDEADEAK